jgi:hypothetical protein
MNEPFPTNPLNPTNPFVQAAHVWQPAITIDLDQISPVNFRQALADFKVWSDGQPDDPVHLNNGWHDIDPPLAERLLRRNKKNRVVQLEVVKKYVRRMKAGVWRPTGQAIILDTNGELHDAQHRLWAGYLSGCIFNSYVVADVPEQDDLFAYIDDSKPRSAADALYTSGGNGLAAMVASAIKIADKYDRNGFSVLNNKRIVRPMDNIEVLAYHRAHPEINEACHEMASNASKAVRVISHKGIAGFIGYKILTLYGQRKLMEFMRPLGTGANLSEGDPILALRDRLSQVAEEGDDDLKIGHKVALIIKAFNLFHSQQTVSKRNGLSIRDNEPYPRFQQEEPIPEVETTDAQ